jgi:peroxiredoxin
MRLPAQLAAVLSLALSSLSFADSPSAQPATPYPAPEFTVNMPDGTPLHLSSLRGKVVLLEFMYTTCPHCQHASQVFTQLYKEFGARGFQPVGIAFNEEVFAKNTTPAAVVNEFVQKFNVGYRIGWSDREKVLEFLGLTPFDGFVVPQLVWIDRRGMVRSKTLPRGTDTEHYQEAYWREMIETLTKEPGGAVHKTSTRRPVHTAQK